MATSLLFVDLSFNWLKFGDFHTKTKGMLLAAQDQALPTRLINTLYMMNIALLCVDFVENKMKLLSISSVGIRYKFLASTQYKSRHDSVAKIVHFWLCLVHFNI